MLAGMNLELIEEADMTPETDAAIKRLLCACFPPDVDAFSKSRHWHGSAPAYTVLQRDANDVVGQVGVVLRTVRVGDRQVDIAGIQSLAVDPDLQGSMLAWALMRRCMREAKSRGVPFGILFCVPELETLYAAMRWQTVEVNVTMAFEGRHQPIPGKNICMVLDLGGGEWPQGDIDLQGPDW